MNWPASNRTDLLNSNLNQINDLLSENGAVYDFLVGDVTSDGYTHLIYYTGNRLLKAWLTDGIICLAADDKNDDSNKSSGRSKGGTATSTYAISVSKADNGTLTASSSPAGKDTAVTITASPAEGYELDSLTVTDANGNKLALTDNGNGKYTFTMPDSKVTVQGAFVMSDDDANISFTMHPGALMIMTLLPGL